MASPTRSENDLARLRSDLAGLAVTLGWIRFERALLLKSWEDQLREPAGQPGGGRWTSGGSSATGTRNDVRDSETTGSVGSDASGAQTQEEVVTEDGSRVLTIRIRSNPRADWDEQHTVTTPDGESTIFETSGRTQTIRDGETGTILGRSTLTDAGVRPEAFVQTVRSPRGLGNAVARAIEAAGVLFATLSGRNDRFGKTIFEAPASEYRPGEDLSSRPVWVGPVSQRDLDLACPRNGEVQALADQMTARVRASGHYKNAQEFGNEVHRLIAADINSRGDRNFVAEKTYVPNPASGIIYGAVGSIRLDVLERIDPDTVCVYDHKTGDRGVRTRYVTKLLPIVQKHFPTAKRIIVIEIRPKP